MKSFASLLTVTLCATACVLGCSSESDDPTYVVGSEGLACDVAGPEGTIAAPTLNLEAVAAVTSQTETWVDYEYHGTATVSASSATVGLTVETTDGAVLTLPLTIDAEAPFNSIALTQLAVGDSLWVDWVAESLTKPANTAGAMYWTDDRELSVLTVSTEEGGDLLYGNLTDHSYQEWPTTYEAFDLELDSELACTTTEKHSCVEEGYLVTEEFGLSLSGVATAYVGHPLQTERSGRTLTFLLSYAYDETGTANTECADFSLNRGLSLSVWAPAP